MIKLTCKNCNSVFYSYPSRLTGKGGHKALYCSKKCANYVSQNGKETRFKDGHIPSKNRQLPKGENHFAWKGDKVGYRGLHYWLVRQKGKALICAHCGKHYDKPRSIQWANIDHQYRRDINDFIPLCIDCHAEYDKKL